MNLPPGITNRVARKGPPPPPKPPKRAPIKTVPEGEELIDVPVSESGLGAYHSTSEETGEVLKEEEEIKSEFERNGEEKESFRHESSHVNETTNFNTSSTEEKNEDNFNQQPNSFNANEKQSFINNEQQLKPQKVEILNEVQTGETFVPPAPRKPIVPPSKKSGGAVQGRKPINIPKPPVKTLIDENNNEANEVSKEHSNRFPEFNDEEIKEQTNKGDEYSDQKQNEKHLEFETPRKEFEEEPLIYHPPVIIKEKVNAHPSKRPPAINEKSCSKKISEMKNKLKDHSIRRDKLLESCESESEREDEKKLQSSVKQTRTNVLDQQVTEQRNSLVDENEQFEGTERRKANDREEKDNEYESAESKLVKEQEQQEFYQNDENFTISEQPEVESNNFHQPIELPINEQQSTHIENPNNEPHSQFMIHEIKVPIISNDRVSNIQDPIGEKNMEEEETTNQKEDKKMKEIEVAAPNNHKSKISSEKVINELKNLRCLSEEKEKVEVFELIESFSAQKESYLKNAQELTKLCQENRYEEEKKITIINELLAKLEEQNIRLHSILMQS